MKKLTKEYVDILVKMSVDKSLARKFLHRQLYDIRNEVVREHYLKMYEYIDQVTVL